jgi:hypothetical protein
MLPTTVCATIQSFLHRVNQHYISALSSIDTFQSISASIDQSTMEILVPSSLSLSMHSSNDDDHAAAAADNDDGSAINNDKNDNARKKKNVIDEFNLNDDIYDDDDDKDNEGNKEDIKYTSHLIEEALKLPGSSLFIMAGSSAYQRVLHNNSSSSRSTNDDHHDHNHRESIYSSNKILLSYMTGRLLMHLSISYVYYLYRTLLRDIVITATTTKSTTTTTTTASQAVHHSLKNDVDGDATITPEDAIVDVNGDGGGDKDGGGGDGGDEDGGCSLLNTAVLEEPSLQVIFDLHVLGIYLSTHLSIHLFVYLSIDLSIHLSTYISIDLSIHPYIHISKHHIDLSLLIYHLITYHIISY